ncbi:MAG: TDP-N-acetylfucosamine:lipid II N-acetylfucosaminyltransferase [Puniceicoccales bacterium]
MFLHIIQAEPKFPQLIYRYFEAAMPGQHIYMLIHDNDGLCENVPGARPLLRAEELRQIFKEHDNIDGVMLHGVFRQVFDFLDAVPEEIKIAWFVWGFEAYEFLNPGDWGLFEPRTLAYRHKTPWKRFRARLRPHYRKWQGKLRVFHQVMSRIDYICTHVREEYELMGERGYTGKKQQWREIPVVPLSDLLSDDIKIVDASCRDIQVGNSATPTNNHVDVFYRLREVCLDGRKVVVPLSYGAGDYRDFVLREGRRLLGDAFDPVVDFMPLDQYLSRLHTCGTVIFNNYRQQALGNVISALWAGKTVYMGPSSALRGYQRVGLPVFHFGTQFDVERQLPAADDIERSRKILTQWMGDEASISHLRTFLLSLQE